MKRILLPMAVLAVVLMGQWAWAREAAEMPDDQMFLLAMEGMTKFMNRESVQDAQQIFAQIHSTHEQSNLLEQYAQAILDIHDGDLQGGLTLVRILSLDASFPATLDRYGLPSLDTIKTYIEARMAEDAGNISEACGKYLSITDFWDAVNRAVYLMPLLPSPSATLPVTPSPTPEPTAEPTPTPDPNDPANYGLCAYVSGLSDGYSFGVNQGGHEVFWGIKINLFNWNDADLDLRVTGVSWASDAAMVTTTVGELSDACQAAWYSARSGGTTVLIWPSGMIFSSEYAAIAPGVEMLVCLPNRPSLAGLQTITLQVGDTHIQVRVNLKYTSDYQTGYGWATSGWNLWYNVLSGPDRLAVMEHIYDASRLEFGAQAGFTAWANDSSQYQGEVEYDYATFDVYDIYNASLVPPEGEFNLFGTFKRGSSGLNVMQLQGTLQRLGYLPANVTIDGSFGAQTESAVNAARRDLGLAQTGIADTTFLQMLYAK